MIKAVEKKLLFDSSSEFISKILFIAFYVFVLVQSFSLVGNSPSQFPLFFLGMLFFLLTLINSLMGVCVFVATIPLLNGIYLVNGFDCVTMAFAGVYLAWLPGRVLKKTAFRPVSTPGTIVTLITVIVLLNLLFVASRISDGLVPSSSWWQWFITFPLASQNDPLWQVNAALVILQGLFLFRVVEIELVDRESFIILVKSLCIQAFIVLICAVYQFVSLKYREFDFIRLNYPFHDIHSFGSYVVLLFGIFTSLFLNVLKFPKKSHDNKPLGADFYQSNSQFRGFESRLFLSKLAIGFCVILFCFLVVYSFSRATWLAMILIICLLCLVRLKIRLIIICFVSVVILGIVANSFLSPRLMQSDDLAMRKIASFLDVKKIGTDENLLLRAELWRRALAAAKEQPVTGIGVGNFYRNNELFQSRPLGKWDRENAHNYYLQFLAEMGVPGLVLFLSVFLSLYIPHVFFSRRDVCNNKINVIITSFLWGLGGYLLTMLTGHPLLLVTQQFLFWTIVALISSGQMHQEPKTEGGSFVKGIMGKVSIIAFSIYVLGFCFNITQKGLETIPKGYGLYSQEDWSGTRMQWMAKKAEYYLPGNTRELNLQVVAQPFNSQPPEGLTLSVSVNETVVDRVNFVDGGSRKLSYDLSTLNSMENKITLEVNNVFCPKKIGLNDDPRTLGVAIGFDG